MPYLGEPYDQSYFEGDNTRREGYPHYGEWFVRHDFAVVWADDIEAETGLVVGKDVLVVGCAYGFLVAELEARGANVIGIDISAYAIAEANSRFPGLTFVEGDFLSSPFSNNQFDMSVSMGVLGCMNTDVEIGNFLSETRRVVKNANKLYYFLEDYSTSSHGTIYQNRTPAEWLLAMEAGLPGPFSFDVQDVGHLPVYYRTRVVVS
jgi:SAM-dependent methyltransferase